ncbi:MAG TPA: sulfotransferase [Solirubrobacteraceae bacterium]|nr:sulfotransferase [Solirubrobacteraceae bacterium]
MPDSATAAQSGLPSTTVRPRVLYVMGAGRSGSTILGVTLGNCPGVFYAGELDAWLARSGEPQLSDPEREEFWSAVRASVPDAAPLYGLEPQRAIERSISLLRVHKWRARRRMRPAYRRVAEELYVAIARQAGETVIVDSSHYPLRARELQALDGIDLHLLYLARDPQSVVASFENREVAQYSKSVLTTNVYLWLTNLLAVLVFIRHPRERRLLVRYEDFIADPPAVLRRILEPRASGAPVAIAPDLGALATGIPFQGNRVIRSPQVGLRAGTERPSRRSLVTAVLQLPWRIVLARLQPRTSPPEEVPRAGGE